MVDTTASQFALTKGYSKTVEANVLVALYWAQPARAASLPWFERVVPHNQLADGISRGDRTATQELGAVFLDVDWSDLYVILADSCTDPSFPIAQCIARIQLWAARERAGLKKP